MIFFLSRKLLGTSLYLTFLSYVPWWVWVCFLFLVFFHSLYWILSFHSLESWYLGMFLVLFLFLHSLFEIYFTYHTIHPLKLYSSMGFIIPDDSKSYHSKSYHSRAEFHFAHFFVLSFTLLSRASVLQFFRKQIPLAKINYWQWVEEIRTQSHFQAPPSHLSLLWWCSVLHSSTVQRFWGKTGFLLSVHLSADT